MVVSSMSEYVASRSIQKPETRCHAYSLMRAAGEVVINFAFMFMTFFVISELFKSRKYEPSKGTLDQLTKQYIHNHLFYRFVSLTTPDSDIVARKLEKKIRAGKLGMKPFLNPL